jgi:hypothetical protein
VKRLAADRSPRWAFMERFEVPDYDDPERNYLTRWRVIQTPWFGIYVHRMDGPDSRATLHDHPWPFVSFVLRGGYWEHTNYEGDASGWRYVGRVNIKRATDLHYIDELARTPTWTLMLVGRRRRTWGYVDRDGGWTAFNYHPHAEEFDLAMRTRRILREIAEGDL